MSLYLLENRFTLPDVKLEDAGVYNCTTLTTTGSAEKMYNLIVKCK